MLLINLSLNKDLVTWSLKVVAGINAVCNLKLKYLLHLIKSRTSRPPPAGKFVDIPLGNQIFWALKAPHYRISIHRLSPSFSLSVCLVHYYVEALKLDFLILSCPSNYLSRWRRQRWLSMACNLIMTPAASGDRGTEILNYQQMLLNFYSRNIGGQIL